MDREKVLDTLNALLELELAGVVRYTHYSFMVFGPNRIPIVHWLRGQARESLTHAEQVGEHITTLGGHPSLKVTNLLETHKHSVQDILRESVEHERAQLDLYRQLLQLVQNESISLEDFARRMIAEEETHIAEVEKMLRTPQ
ncbi:MAG: bacterioferritin [Acidobacteria bacterium]|nr:MAG: bacterioferritin [Acidobacteriota bacterium]